MGVSKRCCPVCAHLLRLLSTCNGKRFVTTGEHSTITPCSLPEWLPAHIIKEMVVEFGSRLRRELVELLQRTEVLRRRTCSTDTRRISLDSIGSDLQLEADTLDPEIVTKSISYDPTESQAGYEF